MSQMEKSKEIFKYLLLFTQEATDDHSTTEECIWKQSNVTLIWLRELQIPNPSLPSNLLQSD